MQGVVFSLGKTTSMITRISGALARHKYMLAYQYYQVYGLCTQYSAAYKAQYACTCIEAVKVMGSHCITGYGRDVRGTERHQRPAADPPLPEGPHEDQPLPEVLRLRRREFSSPTFYLINFHKMY